MEKIKYISLFSGIGAFEKALDRLQIPYDLVNFCEFDKYAIKSYCAIHGVDESKNLGDITKVDEKELPKDIDLITYGFPCQDISLAGKQKGLFHEDGTQTRSGLFFEALRIIEETQPRVAIAENVKNLTGKKFKSQFEIVLKSLDQSGYNNYWKVLNAKDFGIPQNRERVFIISIRKDIDKGFEFPEGFQLELRLKDMLDQDVANKFYLSDEQISNVKINNLNALIYDKSMIGYEEHAREYNDIMPTITSREYKEPRLVNERCIQAATLDIKGQDIVKRVYSDEGLSPTLTNMQGGNRQPKIIVHDIPQIEPGADNLKIRKLTPKECYRLMNFDDDDFSKAEAVNSNTQLYKQAGNSVVVSVPYYILKNLIESNILIEKENEMELKIYSPPGQINQIEWNHDEIKKEVAEKVELYKNLVYSDDQIKSAKTDRATLNKFVTALENKRKEIKKQCLKPYEDFEKQVKEIVAIVNEPIMMIDSQIKEHEDKEKADKRDQITAAFDEMTKADFVTLDKIFDDKWLNKSVSLKKVTEEMQTKVQRVDADIQTISELQEYSFEALETYKQTLDINTAITEGKRLADIQQRKEESAAAAEENQTDTAAKQWIGFQAFMSVDQAKALNDFFKRNNIEFKAV